jgi:hypothetical protein
VDAVIENEDGSVVLKQADVAEGESVVVIKMSDALAVTMKGFSPYDMMFNSGDVSFADQCKANGFYPGVSTMMDVLQQSVMQAAYKSDSPATAADTVSKMFDEAKAYAVGLLQALPTAAFKAEANANGSMAGVPGTPGGEQTTTSNLGGTKVKDPLAGELPGSENSATGTGDGSQVAKADAVTGECDPTGPAGMKGKKKTPAAGTQEDGTGSGAAAATSMKAAPEGSAEEEAAETPAEEAAEKAKAKAKKADGDPIAAFGKLLEDGLKSLGAQFTTQLTESVGQVQKSVDGLKGQFEGLSTKVGEVEGVAKAAQAAVKGTVLGADAGADAHQTTQKSDQGGFRGREIDTAYAPRRRPAR